jgi:hypothetical protein
MRPAEWANDACTSLSSEANQSGRDWLADLRKGLRRMAASCPMIAASWNMNLPSRFMPAAPWGVQGGPQQGCHPSFTARARDRASLAARAPPPSPSARRQTAFPGNGRPAAAEFVGIDVGPIGPNGRAQFHVHLSLSGEGRVAENGLEDGSAPVRPQIHRPLRSRRSPRLRMGRTSTSTARHSTTASSTSSWRASSSRPPTIG